MAILNLWQFFFFLILWQFWMYGNFEFVAIMNLGQFWIYGNFESVAILYLKLITPISSLHRVVGLQLFSVSCCLKFDSVEKNGRPVMTTITSSILKYKPWTNFPGVNVRFGMAHDRKDCLTGQRQHPCRLKPIENVSMLRGVNRWSTPNKSWWPPGWTPPPHNHTKSEQSNLFFAILSMVN